MNIQLKKCGEDVFIHQFSEIKRPHLCEFGNHISIDFGVVITTQMILGDYIHISPNVTCIGGVEGTFIAKGFNNIMAGARIICVSDRFDDSGLFGALIPPEFKGKQIKSPVIMEEFSNIATNAVALPGSILRQGVLLSIGSVLYGDTEPWTVYKGNPAIPVKQIDKTKILELSKKMGYEFNK